MSLNFLHSDCRHVPEESLRRRPNEFHLKAYARLSSMLRPYRDADPARLKITGSGEWGLEQYLGPELRLPFLEPKVLRAIPRNALPFPDTLSENRDRTLELLKLWDSRGLLYLSFEQKQPRELTRVFGAYKTDLHDRQIGDRRGANGLEGRVRGPSRELPPGHLLTCLTVPRGSKLVGASTDRADFYHQAKISASKIEGNATGPPFRLRDLEGTKTLSSVREIAAVSLRSGVSSAEAFGASCLVSPQVPPSLLFDPQTKVCRCFKSLYQGDHAGVDFATEAHGEMLNRAGLLKAPHRLQAKRAPSRTGPWQALIIDDFFALSVEARETDPLSSAAADLVAKAKETYKAEGVVGSPHKDVLGSEVFTAAGAQVDSSSGPLASGRVFVSAPTEKLLALSVISLRAAALPAISEELASSLSGSWISALMFRRCLFSIFDGFFALGKSDPGQASGSHLRFLPRKEAQELVLLASLAPVMMSNVAASFCDRIYCSDSSSVKGAFCSSEASPEVAASLWLSADKKGCYTKLDPEGSPNHNELEALEIDDPPRPLAFDFDALCLFAGSQPPAEACARLGMRVSPIIDLGCSSEFDVLKPSVLEWLLYLIGTGRARSLLVVLPSLELTHRSSRTAAKVEKGTALAMRGPLMRSTGLVARTSKAR
ncbi:unnamed protein product [Symbiodinium natans]|uniref:Uncharacterized protein n=1 Tax=Symbiodinium natans TaxID=878477 RepID=A0A812I750_9DINO|nr:unnamed protein product [Symbiodinium natans]